MSGRTTTAADPESGARAAALELVLAVSDNDVIGRGNALPWRLPADLRRFKALTLGRPILMGRKTYQSIGKALPGRPNLVLTRSPEFHPGDCRVFDTLEAARNAVAGEPALLVIGGAEIYAQCLPYATRLHVTRVHARVEGDTFFSGWRDASWHETSCDYHAADERNEHPCSFVTLERSRP